MTSQPLLQKLSKYSSSLAFAFSVHSVRYNDFSTAVLTLHCNSKFVKDFENKSNRSSKYERLIRPQDDPPSHNVMLTFLRVETPSICNTATISLLLFHSLVSPALNSHPQKKTCLRTQSLANCNFRPCRTPNLTSYFSLPTHIPEPLIQ